MANDMTLKPQTGEQEDREEQEFNQLVGSIVTEQERQGKALDWIAQALNEMYQESRRNQHLTQKVLHVPVYPSLYNAGEPIPNLTGNPNQWEEDFIAPPTDEQPA